MEKPFDKYSAYTIYRAAAEQMEGEGYPVPKFTENDIKEDNGDFCLAFDFNILEERVFGMSIPRLKEIYNDMIGKENILLPKTFKVYLGENFHKKPKLPFEPKTTKAKKTNKRVAQGKTEENVTKVESEEINKQKNIYDDIDTYNSIDLPETY